MFVLPLIEGSSRLDPLPLRVGFRGVGKTFPCERWEVLTQSASGAEIIRVMGCDWYVHLEKWEKCGKCYLSYSIV